MRHDKRTDGNQKEGMQAIRQAGHTVRNLSHVGNGIPDNIVITRLHKVHLWLEWKIPGEKLTEAEADLFQLLPGGPVRIARSAQEALDICEDADWSEDEE